MKVGTVYLVGAGPGDPSLLTLRAAELLGAVRIVAHDLLLSPQILQMARPDAELVPVGRRQGDPKIDYRVHPKVVEFARQGHDVLRLKCGDPMIFGRGGEEAQALRELGIPYQIVPGISAALGAASYTGISLTHRELASDCSLATGHGIPGRHFTRSNWESLAQGTGTLALYMSLGKAQEVLERLMEHGRAGSTPAAFVFRATQPDQEVLLGRVDSLAARVHGRRHKGPALLLVGQSTTLHREIAWTQNCPLLGARVLVARARAGSSRIASDFRRLGASVIEAPILDSHPCLGSAQIQDFLGEPSRPNADVLLWGNEQAVQAAQRWIRESVAESAAHAPIWVALDHRSGRALQALGVQDLTTLSGATPETLAPHLSSWRGKAVHLLTHSVGRPNLEGWLQDAGVVFSWLGLHELHERWPAQIRQSFDLVVLPSSSAAKALLASPWATPWKKDCPMLVFGDKTAKEARRWGAERILPVPPGQAAAVATDLLRSSGEQERQSWIQGEEGDFVALAPDSESERHR